MSPSQRALATSSAHPLSRSRSRELIAEGRCNARSRACTSRRISGPIFGAESDQSHPGTCPPESAGFTGSTRWKSLKTSALTRSLSDSKTQHRVPHCNEVSSATADCPPSSAAHEQNLKPTTNRENVHTIQTHRSESQATQWRCISTADEHVSSGSPAD